MRQGQINNKLLAQISYLPLRNENVPGTQGFPDFSLVTAVDEKFFPNVLDDIETIGALMRRKRTQLRRTEYRRVAGKTVWFGPFLVCSAKLSNR